MSEKLALVGNKMFSTPIAADTIKEPMNRLLRPEDMDQLVVPRVNQEILGKLPKHPQDGEQGTCQCARPHCEGSIGYTPVDALRKGLAKTQAVIRDVVDAISLLGRANYDLSLNCRYAI